MRWPLAFFFLFFGATTPGHSTTILLPGGSTWRYFSEGVPPTNWFQPNFNHAAWPSGRAQLGYGEDDEETVLFPDGTEAPQTLYFRHSFTFSNSPPIVAATMQVLADDGVVVYFDGQEIGRRNLPSGPLSHTTFALSNREAGEAITFQFGVAGFRFRTNNHVIAVAVYQHPNGRHDCSFDLELVTGIVPDLPQVAITSPTNKSVRNVGSILIQTATSDIAGHIDRVQFYTNGFLLGESTQEPFSFLWQAVAGRHRLAARAQNNFGYLNDSEAIYVQVGPSTPVVALRGPYLQSGSPGSIVIRWRTDWFCESVVRFGTNLLLSTAVTNLTPNIDHEVKLTGLTPNTQYFYSIGNLSGTFAEGDQYYFRTAPTNAQPLRLWVIGDSGTSDTNAARVHDAYQQVTTNHTDVWLMLGDNAYGAGYDYEYQTAVFEMYPDLLRNTVLWPTLGNHDAGDAEPGRFMPYLDIFTLPKNAEAGGIASGAELYYSFDYAHVHFVCLDSYISDRSSNGPMASWLRADLASTDKDWIIAFWHHPPYSMGGHPSDGEYYLIEMRENMVPILEEYGVDLVLAGHSHVYERSFFLNGHYGYSWQLQPSMILDSGLGRPNQPYRKPAGGLGSHRGAVYTVCGCSGAGGEETFDHHPAMAVIYGGFGSMIITIDGLRLEAQFLRPNRDIDDRFVIDKSTPGDVQPRLSIARGTNGPVISWPTSFPAFDLYGSHQLPAQEWEPFSAQPRMIGRRNSVELTNTAGKSFFRLQSRD